MNALHERIKKTRQEFLETLKKATSLSELEQLRVTYLGRKGILADLMTELKTLSLEEKKELGPLLNQLKQEAEEAYSKIEQEFHHNKIKQELQKKQAFDVTAYKPHTVQGSLHPLTQMTQRIEDIFISMGYEIAFGPEVETDFYNFEALNIAADHPARDMWDTFWLDVPGLLLRTHTSTVQIHTMQQQKPPLAIVAPGRAYRHEATDATHDYVFMQTEGLLIGKNISMGHLLATAQTFLRALFDKKDIQIRVRPGYFPFVEPGVEIDSSCPFCKHGCSVCKKTGWIEISGAGLVHPNVLKSCEIDPEVYSGFAFGFGLTRLVMLQYGINDIRLLHQPNIEFLKQF